MSFLTTTFNTLRAGASLGPWLLRHREAVSRPVIEAFITEVRSLPGVEKVGVVGFCWGGRYAILAAQEPFSGEGGKGGEAAYVAHPSLCAIPGDFEGVCVPLSGALGETDSYLGMGEVRKIEEVMGRKKRERGVEGEVVVYEGQVHGFALRGDQENPEDKKALDAAAQQGIDWFKKHLS
jgi:dienelactone hydrolase